MRVAFSLFVFLLALISAAQAPPRVSWTAEIYPPDARAGEGAQIRIKGKVDEGWHVYALQQPEGVTSTEIKITSGRDAFSQIGDPEQQFPEFVPDATLGTDVGKFKGEFLLCVPVILAKDAAGKAVTLDILSQACDDKSCERPVTQAVSVAMNLASGEARKERSVAISELPDEGTTEPAPTPAPKAAEKADKGSAASQEVQTYKDKPILEFLAFAFVSGLLALLTPCVFPMIPVTVSYFAKRSQTHPDQKLTGPLAYTFGIISTFTIVGIAVSLIAGPKSVQNFATHPVTNIFLGLLFVVLSLSLFGVYEIGMPSWLVNKASAGRTKGGLVGPMMMGLTFSLTSFTCTVAFVGTLLAAAFHGEVWFAAAGLFVFSLAFASPFFLLAMFPGAMNKIPRAGAWMATTKAAMGFLELAAALKFFQLADNVVLAGWITRPVFLGIWSTIFLCGALFLLGWMVFPEQSGTPIGWARRGFGLAFAAVGIWCWVGLAGQSMGGLNAFLPPDPYPSKTGAPVAGKDELTWLKSFDQALEQAKKEDKLVFIDFTGYT